MSKNKQLVILITGVGGNVGQGILRIVKSTYQNIKIVGIDINSFTAGNCLIDVFYKVPYATLFKEYIEIVVDITLKEGVDLLIPTTDYEAYYLSLFKNKFSCIIAVNDASICKMCLDKYETFKELDKNKIPFSKTYLPSEFNNQFDKIIAKPREGRGSRGLLIDYVDYKTLSDQEYLIQEFHEGMEFTAAVYVSYLTNNLIGFINLERELSNGLTIQCQVNNEHNIEVENLLKLLLKKYKFKGAFNIQFIIDNKGKINPFEINCRISGTNSIRHNFGFQDVQYTIDELLFRKTIDKPIVSNGFAIRYLADVIYPNGISSKTNKDNFILF